MEKMTITFGFCDFDITIHSICYTDDARFPGEGGWEIDFSAIALIDDEPVTDPILLGKINQKIIEQIREEQVG